jgi:hypothetical protein
MVPDTAVPVKVTVMVLVLFPEVTITPAGSIQLYPVAPGTAITEYTFPVAPLQITDGPVTAPGDGRQMHPELDITVDNPRLFMPAIGSVIELQPQALPELLGF